MIALELERSVRIGLFCAGLLAPVALGVVVRTVGSNPAVIEALAREEAATPCDATRLDASCPAGERCVAGSCTVVHAARLAAEGEPCGGITCAPGLECYRGACERVDALPVAPAACRAPAVQESLFALGRSCAQVRGEPESLLTACGADAWRRISQSNPAFEEQVLAMPGALLVFFPNAMPDEKWSWPNAQVAEFYEEQLARRAAALREAKQILLIGRASLTGGEEVNRRLAERRGEMVQQRLVELFGARLPPIVRWGLADDFVLSLKAMRRRMAAEPIADSAAAAAELMALRQQDFDPDKLSREAWDSLGHTLNRVVFVVPLPCDGHEFIPSPAFAGRGRFERRP